jgi:DNA polymerase-1
MSSIIKIDEFCNQAECKNCGLNGTPKVLSYIANNEVVDILVLGQSPGWQEVEKGRPFIGDSGSLINPILTQYSPNIAYINVLLCRPLDVVEKKDRVPTSEEIRCCRDRFREDFSFIVDNYHPKIVMVLGVPAKKEFQRLVKMRPEYGQLIVMTFDHPSFILRNSHMKPRYITQLHNALKSVFGGTSNDTIKDFVTYTDNVKMQFLGDVMSSKRIGVDIETNSLDMFSLNFIIGTVAVSCDKATYFFDGREKDIREFGVLLDILKDGKVQKVFADILFDVTSFKQYGIEVVNYTDLFPLAFIYDNTYLEYSLEAITMRYMPELAEYKAKFQSSIESNLYLNAQTEELRNYNCMDAYCTRVLYNGLYDKLPAKPKAIFDKVTVRLLPVLVVMKCSGMKIDTQLLASYRKTFEGRYNDLAKFFLDKHGITSINSVPQVSKWLFQTLKLKPIKFNDPTAAQKAKGLKKGNPSTDKEVLEAYASQVPDVKLLYEARRVANILAYFVPSIEDSLDQEDFVHPNYKHYGIQSFRLACLRPNLQGIPRDETGIEVLDKYPLRRLFISRSPSSVMAEFDYSQQEVRIVAELARDVKMLEAFAKGEDIHTFVASLVFNKAISSITKQERQIAKGCVFGAIFGASAGEMSVRLRIPEQKAQAYLDRFFDIFSSIDSFIRRQHAALIKDSCISTIFGRPRKFILHRHNMSDSKREAGNHAIQAVAADITFSSLIQICDRLTKEDLLNKGVYLIHSVHDSILLDIEKDKLQHIVDTVSGIMSGVPNILGFKVKFPVDCKLGTRWGQSEKLEEVLKCS